MTGELSGVPRQSTESASGGSAGTSPGGGLKYFEILVEAMNSGGVSKGLVLRFAVTPEPPVLLGYSPGTFQRFVLEQPIVDHNPLLDTSKGGNATMYRVHALGNASDLSYYGLGIHYDSGRLFGTPSKLIRESSSHRQQHEVH